MLSDMTKRKRKLTAAEKKARKWRREETTTIFIHGKQKRVPVDRTRTVEGMDVDEFIRRNADPIWLHQNEMWEYMEPQEPLELLEPCKALDDESPR